MLTAATLGWPSGGAAQSPEVEVLAALESLIADGREPSQVVAHVNGREVTRREVELPIAFSAMDDERQLTWDVSLKRAIDHELLVQAAEAAGVVVTEAEVDQMVANTLQPLDAGLLSPDDEALMRAALEAAGTTPVEAPSDAAYRDAMRNVLLVGRYVSSTGAERADLVTELRESATIEIYSTR